MGYKYTSLEELRKKKELLKKDIAETESLLTFENTKESLSAVTNGFTDKYLKNETTENGAIKTAIKKEAILKEISSGVREKILSKNAVLGFADNAISGGAFDDVVRLGAVTLVGNFAKKNIKSGSWKKKLIGLALIYLAPFLLKLIRKKLEEYQKNRSVTSMEQLI